MTIPREWRPIPVVDELRIGGQFDGGYVVPARVLRETDTLLSFGVSDNWTFEEEFCKRRSGIRLLAFDCNIGGRFWLKRFVAPALAATLRFRFSSLSKITDWVRFKWFFSRKNRELRLRKIVYANRISAFIKEIEATHVVTHIDANNFSGIDDRGDRITLEMTFISRSLCADDELKSDAMVRGLSLDQPNNPERPEIELSFESSLEGHRNLAHLRSN